MDSSPASTVVRSRLVESFLRSRVSGVVAFLAVLWVVFSILAPRFMQVDNFIIIGFNSSILVIAVCAETIVLLTRNFDLSIGSIMGLVGYLAADTAAKNHDIGPALILLALGVGAVLGLVNGLLVGYGRIPSIIATLGTLSVFRGLTYLYAGGLEVTSYELPSWMLASVDLRLFGVPILVFVAIFVVAVVATFLNSWPIGRRVRAVGSSPTTAYYYGIRPVRVVVVAYTLCGLFGGLAGYIYAAHIGTVTVVLASGWELTTLAAAVIGGVSTMGGSGSIVGAALGAVVLATVDNGLILLNVAEYWRLLVQGGAIVLAVTVDAALSGRARAGSRRLLAP
jgi:rhamnose transport system permease protein